MLRNNLSIAAVELCTAAVIAYLSYTISPTRLLKVKLAFFFPFVALFPLTFSMYPCPNTVLVFQCLIVASFFTHVPAHPIFLKSFPVSKRFRHTAGITAMSRTTTAILSAFGFSALTEIFGQIGILLILFPMGMCFTWGLNYFEQKQVKEREQALARQNKYFF